MLAWHSLKFLGVVFLGILPGIGWCQEWQAFPGAQIAAESYADGDSFRVRWTAPDGETREEIIRLYFVDCPETEASADSDRRRLLEQSRYFGLEDPREMAEYGKKAAEVSAELLREPFTLHTAMARSPGRSATPRIYGMITLADGRDLGAVLVEQGWARARGMSRQLPDGTKAADYQEMLRDRELGAAMSRRGVWAASNPEKIAELRFDQRREASELDRVFSEETSDRKININTATERELQQLSGVGPALARRIMEFRPYLDRDDLRRVPGLGDLSIARFEEQITFETPQPD